MTLDESFPLFNQTWRSRTVLFFVLEITTKFSLVVLSLIRFDKQTKHFYIFAMRVTKMASSQKWRC
jgi:hypothetical protein